MGKFRIPLARPFIPPKAHQYIHEVLSSGILTKGHYVKKLEELVCEYVKAHHCIAVSSGTTALEASFSAIIELYGSPDIVIIPDFTFPATLNAVIRSLKGHKPINLYLVDVRMDTYTIDTTIVERIMTEFNTFAEFVVAIPVHIFGYPANDIELQHILSKVKRYVIIGDAAGALGAKINGNTVNMYETLTCISFHPRKIVTTGEGGMVITNNSEIADFIRGLRDHGRTLKSNGLIFKFPGTNYRLSELQAAIGVAQMEVIDNIIAERRRIAEHYTELIDKYLHNTVIPPVEEHNFYHVYQSYVVRLPSEIDQACVIDVMRNKYSVEIQISSYALSNLPYIKSYKYIHKKLNGVSHFLERHTVALPIYNGMSLHDVEYVVKALRETIGVCNIENRSS